MEMNFRKNFAALRKKNEYTQERIAEKLGLSRQAITKWESGESEPDMKRLVELANIFDIRVDELICGNLYDDIDFREETNSKLDSILEEIRNLKNQSNAREVTDIDENLDGELFFEYMMMLDEPDEEIDAIKTYLQAGYEPIDEYMKEGFDSVWEAIRHLIAIERGSVPEILSHMYDLSSIMYETEYDKTNPQNGYIEYMSKIADILPTMSAILKNEIMLEMKNPGRFV